MSKNVSPKRFIYENGILILKDRDNEALQMSIKKKIEEDFYEVEPRYNSNLLLGKYNSEKKKNFKLEYPMLSPLSNINNNNKINSKIFKTQIDEDIKKENKNIETDNDLYNYIEVNEYETINNEDIDKDINDNDNDNNNNNVNEYSSNEYNDNNNNNFKSLEVNPSYIRRNQRLQRKINQSKISSQIEKICKYLYTSPKKNDKDNIRFKMYEKENEYIKKLKKNYLVNEDLINKQTYRNRIKRNQSNKSNEFLYNNNQLYKYLNNNILNDKEIIKKYYDNQNSSLNSNTIDIEKLTRIRFENYSRNYPRYRHPQIYRLKSGNKSSDENDIKLPPIKTGNQNHIELNEYIPEKKGNKKSDQRKEYVVYKIMRINRPQKFHI